MNYLNVDFKKIKGNGVYFEDSSEPWGIVDAAIFDCSKSLVSALKIKTLSLIPIFKTARISSVAGLEYKKIIIKKDANITSYAFFKSHSPNTIDIPPSERSLPTTSNLGKVRDIRFNFETGELCDIVVSKNFISRNRRIPVNKIYLNDNTIYVENL